MVPRKKRVKPDRVESIFRMNPKLASWLDREAKRTGRSRTALMHEWLEALPRIRQCLEKADPVGYDDSGQPAYALSSTEIVGGAVIEELSGLRMIPDWLVELRREEARQAKRAVEWRRACEQARAELGPDATDGQVMGRAFELQSSKALGDGASK